jgi:pimeloyl-ACP methyl ester carboxylesterase
VILSRGRLSPAEMFPAGDARFRTSYIPTQTGLRLRVVECGDPRAAETVVCLHGWICSVYTYRAVMLLLAEAGRRVIAIDLPGHGLSDKPKEHAYYTVDAMAGCLVDVLDALGITEATYVGHSMGGAIAARIARQHPERVKALVLCAPVGFGRILSLNVAVMLTPRVLLPVLPYLTMRWIVPTVFRWVYGTLRTPTPRDYDEYWAPTQFPGFVRAVRLLLQTFDWQIGEHGGLDGITRPATIMYGGRDELIVGRAAQRYTQIILNTRLVGIPESGHVVPEEAPEQVVAAVLDVGTRVSYER